MPFTHRLQKVHPRRSLSYCSFLSSVAVSEAPPAIVGVGVVEVDDIFSTRSFPFVVVMVAPPTVVFPLARSREVSMARESASHMPPIKSAQKRFSIGANGSATPNSRALIYNSRELLYCIF